MKEALMIHSAATDVKNEPVCLEEEKKEEKKGKKKKKVLSAKVCNHIFLNGVLTCVHAHQVSSLNPSGPGSCMQMHSQGRAYHIYLIFLF